MKITTIVTTKHDSLKTNLYVASKTNNWISHISTKFN